MSDVFHIINEISRQPVENPAALVIHSGRVLGLANTGRREHHADREEEHNARQRAIAASTGIVLVTSRLSSEEASMRSIAGPERTGCTAAA